MCRLTRGWSSSLLGNVARGLGIGLALVGMVMNLRVP
jgi:hypothetical protein